MVSSVPGTGSTLFCQGNSLGELMHKLHHAVQFMLRNDHDPTAEEWAIMDYDDFCSIVLKELQRPLSIV
jgi:antirestriction protein